MREVTLVWPSLDLSGLKDPDEILFLDFPNLERLQSEAASIAAFYESQGVHVHWLRPPAFPPNFLFQRDLYFMTPDGAVLARPASVQRAAEARLMAEALSDLGVPIIASPRGSAVFEGADALWLNGRTVLVGVGFRTNHEGARFLSDVLRDIGVTVVPLALPDGVQHLLGVINFLDSNLAAVHADKITDAALGVLREARVDVVPCRGEEVTEQRAMNFVTLRPRCIVMAAGCPRTRQKFIEAGVTVYETPIHEYEKAAGGLGCLTGIVFRGADTDAAATRSDTNGDVRKHAVAHSAPYVAAPPTRTPETRDHAGLTVWFTGLGSAGKTTLSQAVYDKLTALGYRTEKLDGDEVRRDLSRDLGFSKEDRDENVRRIGILADLLTRNGVITLVAAISPYRAGRREARQRIGRFIEVYVNAPLAVCQQRDVKGIYRRAQVGELRDVTGCDAPYEPPPAPELEIKTNEMEIAAGADTVVAAILQWFGREPSDSPTN